MLYEHLVPSAKRKSVHVCSYFRKRFGRLEYVCQHWRRPPS